MFFRDSDKNWLDIGLVNNMPDSALEATERQFSALLKAAAGNIPVRLTLYALPGVPRSDAGRQHISSYCDVSDLLNKPVDGLIVSGTEPCTANLMEEAYWASFTQVLDWAEHNTHSTVWSCLAAHAAVLHTDGIRRRTLGAKQFGIFYCSRGADHELTAGVGLGLQMPHSRWNEIPEDALRSCGYAVLTRSEDAGVDCFVRRRKSLFVYFQGHPEYEADSLLLEYRRDIKRFLKHESETYPVMPHGYFDHDVLAVLTALRERALVDRREELIMEFPTATVANTWGSEATRIYRNWLLYIADGKARKARSFRRKAQAGARTWSRGARL